MSYTGPITEEGKARSSRNSLKTGLFSANAFIAEGEQPEFDAARAALIAQLEPETPLEHTYTDEIVHASWRLRRCRILESRILEHETDTGDTAPDPAAIDRARANSHTILRRATAELRRLQTERTLRFNLGFDESHSPGLTDTRQVASGITTDSRQRLLHRKIVELEALEITEDLVNNTPLPRLPALPPAPRSSFCNPLAPRPQTPRNAPCPCKSGEKFKRCCGKNAPPVLTPKAA